MLSKRTNDVIFIAVIVIVIGAIIGLRFYVLGTQDDRIEREQVRNQELLEEINDLQRLISDNPAEAISPVSVLYTRAPSIYDRDRLRYNAFAQLELIGISEFGDRNLSITITENPTLPDNTTFKSLSNDLMAVRLGIAFDPADTQMIYDVITHMHSQQQYFVLQSISYNMNGDQPSRVNVNFITFYNTD